VRVDEATLKQLDLSSAAAKVTTGHLDRFPPLIMDTCLGGPKSPLVPAVVARFRAGFPLASETLTMPRRGFSPRPVTVMDTASRTLYTALVAKLSESLTASRASEDWERHDKFGPPNADDPFYAEYLVEFDIASCYEYVEHSRLREELLLRTMDVEHVELCASFVEELHGRTRGLPQLSESSDVLADTYLEILERALLRNTTQVSRFADDFKVEASSWEIATKIIEDAADQARELGLILAADKTHIWKAATLIARREEADAFLNEYFTEAKTALTTIDFLFGGYGSEPIELPPGEEATVQEALRRIFQDWYAGQPTDMPKHSQFLPAALGILSPPAVRLPDEWLLELVFRQALRLEGVCYYLLARTKEPAENWVTLSKLANMKRQSPWAKIWLLHAAKRQERAESPATASFDSWASIQLTDRHEVVRAEAAWYLVSRVINDFTVDL